MRAEWPIKRLGDLTDLITKGTTPTSVGHAFAPDGINFVKVESISENGQFIESKFAHITQACHDTLRRSQLNCGDILFSIAGALGRTAYVTDDIVPANTNQALAIVRLKKSSEVLPTFVLKALETGFVLDQIEKFKGGVAQQNLSLAQVQEFQIPLPPLPEQQRIVGILDAAFDGIATAKANAEKNLQNARALFESHLQSVFTQRGEGWVDNKLNALTTKIGSGATPRGGEESYKSEGISLIRSLNVHDFGFRYRKLAFLDDAQANELSNVEVQPNDVLLNITGASVARCCIVPEDVLPARVNQHVSIIRPITDKLDASFLHYLLISKTYKDQLLQTGSEGGSTRQAITKAQIQDFTIEYPATLVEQKSIVVKLDTMLVETQRLESLYQRKLAALDELKKSLLHQAFSGVL
jgi:type I restriction enzyme S subunit